jgi:hypothetical protein
MQWWPAPLIERTGEQDRASATQAVAREIDAVRVVDETVEDRVGKTIVGGIDLNNARMRLTRR